MRIDRTLLTLTACVWLLGMSATANGQAPPADKPAATPAPSAVAKTEPIVVDMAKQPPDVQTADELLESRSNELQLFVDLVNTQLQMKRQAVAQAREKRDAAILRAAGRSAEDSIVETIPATQTSPAALRIVPRPPAKP